MGVNVGLVGKDVKVVQQDGFIKVGRLTELNQTYLILEFYDGSNEIVMLAFVKSVSERGRR